MIQIFFVSGFAVQLFAQSIAQLQLILNYNLISLNFELLNFEL